MSYLAFHLFFTLPPILLMGLTLPRPLRALGGRRAQLAIPLIAAVAFSYTTPWDNYLVAQNVWWYGPERVLGTIGFVPYEEYAFFLLQPVLTGLFFFQYTGRRAPSAQASTPWSAWGGFSVFAALSLLGAGLLAAGSAHGVYLGLILAWACPLLAGMWLYDGETLSAHRTTLIYTVAVPTLYLWGADAVAISSGIWTISADLTVGVSVLGLPLEEATFFLMTNMLVVKGILLLLHGSHEALNAPLPTAPEA